MIITQKYHSSHEIDQEFIEPLEELMQEHAPSFEWIKLQEKLAPENVHFSYYLFFGNTKNSPIGFAQVAIKNREEVRAVKKGFFKRKEKVKRKEIVWRSPTSSQEGVVFAPGFLKGGLAKTAEIVEEYNNREEVSQQELMVGDEIFGNAKLLPAPELNRENIVNCLVKNRASYQEYLNHLSLESQKEIKALWRDVYRDKGCRIGEYLNFKECFEYKKQGSCQYKELKKNKEISSYIQLADMFLTFESPDEVFGLVFVFHGSPGQIFFKTYSLREEIKNGLLVQAAIMRFYEEREASKLRFLERAAYSKQLAAWGFTHKSVHILETKTK